MKWSPLRSVLCLGAHADDIEIGCGATLLEIQQSRPDVRIDWVVFSSQGVREAEARASFADWFQKENRGKLRVYSFEDTLFPVQRRELKECFQAIAMETSPDLIFTHRIDDAHQDHRLIAELTWNTFRDHCVLEYEIPKYEGDLGKPNLFVPISELNANRKIESLSSHYLSQHEKPWYRADTFRALLTLRAIECRSETGYAEAFYGKKLTITG